MKGTLVYKVLLMAFTAVIVVGGYFFLRYAYRVTDTMPFAQEIVLIVLGTLITVLITALLLQKQTEVELTKEQTIKYIELKSDIYQQIISDIESFLAARTLTERDLLHLEFFTHRLAIAAAPAVLMEYGRFVTALAAAVRDKDISQADSDEISMALARLTVKMREDLIGAVDAYSHLGGEVIASYILRNADAAIENL